MNRITWHDVEEGLILFDLVITY